LEHDFEKYYPEEFQERVSVILNIRDTQEKRKQKKELLNEVKEWIKDNEEEAKSKFKESAKEVIEKLKNIAKQIV